MESEGGATVARFEDESTVKLHLKMRKVGEGGTSWIEASKINTS